MTLPDRGKANRKDLERPKRILKGESG